MKILPSRTAQVGLWGAGQAPGRLTEKNDKTAIMEVTSTIGVIIVSRTRKALRRAGERLVEFSMKKRRTFWGQRKEQKDRK